MGRRSSQSGGRRAAPSARTDGSRAPRRNRGFGGRNRTRRRGGAASGHVYVAGAAPSGYVGDGGGGTSTAQGHAPPSDWPTLAQQAAHPQRRGGQHLRSSVAGYGGHPGAGMGQGVPGAGSDMGRASGDGASWNSGRRGSGGALSAGGRAVTPARHEECSQQLVAALDRLCPLEPPSVRRFRDGVLGEVQALLVRWVQDVSRQDVSTAGLATMEPMAAARLCVSGSYVTAGCSGGWSGCAANIVSAMHACSLTVCLPSSCYTQLSTWCQLTGR